MRPVGALTLLDAGPARRLDRLLRVGTEIQHRGEHLQIDLHHFSFVARLDRAR